MSVRLTYLRDNGYVTENNDIRHTKVSTFCLPMFDVCVKDFKQFLLNAHVDDKNNLYVIVLSNVDKQVENILTKLSEHNDFLESYDDDDGKELVFKLKIPEKYIDDYHKILNGTYSSISSDYKSILTSDKYYKVTYYPLNEAPVMVNGQVASTMWETLNPSVKKKEIVAKHFGVDFSSVRELIAAPDLKYELYRTIDQLT